MAIAKDNLGSAAKIEFERTHFSSLLLANPNYFGTIKGSKLKAVKAFSGNTTYEKLMCVGFHPQLSQLEAVVHVLKNAGYSESLCSGGSPEYVRFYTSADGGATWHDEGLAKFHAYNVAGPRPLEYAVSLGINPKRTFCIKENILKVRAILSWNVSPTPNNPNFIPVWGNVVNVDVLVDPRRFWPWQDFVLEAELKLPKSLEKLAIINEPLEVSSLVETPLAELHATYTKEKVPGHRYMYPVLSAMSAVPATNPAMMSLDAGVIASIADLKIDIGKLIEAIAKTDGNTDYEELTCVGYDPNNDALVGVIKVKKSSGYSGNMCSTGSREYVAFWVDWGDGAGWTYEGTSSVRVHDVGSMPAGGLQFAVFEALGSVKRRKACWTGPVTAKVRAIMSWQTPPSTSDPNWVPTWGNREETVIQLNPGALAEDYRPMLESVSGVPICSIDQSTGMTNAVYNQPFGGTLTITGMIPTSPDISTADASKLRYRVQVRKLSPLGSWQTVDNDFWISVIERIGIALPVQYSILQQVDGSGYFTYREDMNVGGAGWRLVQNRVLAQWITADPMVGMYEIKVDAKDPVTNIFYSAQTIACAGGGTRTNVKVWLDEKQPTVALAVTGFQRGGGPVQPSAVCDTFLVGDVIHGTYGVADEHAGAFSLTVQPAAMANGALPSPSGKTYPILPNLGENGTWTLDTAAMDPCGYVIRLYAHDRTIVSGGGSWDRETFVGFCLKRG
ncbi:MAG: hypothetical protein H7Y17_06105 [Chlorobia bacterium]|nr:hypothetical protein [Fimbriimonadaceae bacterium]